MDEKYERVCQRAGCGRALAGKGPAARYCSSSCRAHVCRVAKLSRGKEELNTSAPVLQLRPPHRPPPFVAVGIAEPPREQRPEATGLELHLSNGHRLQVGVGFDAPTLRRLLDVLQEGC